FKSEAVRENSRIKKTIFTKLARFDLTRASDLYLNLLGEIREAYAGCPISLFTTNDDLTFESTIEARSEALKTNLEISDVEFGFSIRFGHAIYDPARDFGW